MAKEIIDRLDHAPAEGGSEHQSVAPALADALENSVQLDARTATEVNDPDREATEKAKALNEIKTLFASEVETNMDLAWELLKGQDLASMLDEVVVNQKYYKLFNRFSRNFPNLKTIHYMKDHKPYPTVDFSIYGNKGNFFVTLPKVKKITFRPNTKYSIIKECLSIYPELEELKLTITGLPEATFPEELYNLKNLKVLRLTSKDAILLSKSIGKLENLESLRVTCKKIHTIPSTIGNLTKLKALDLAHCSLHSLPKEIGSLNNLETLDLMGNRLKEVPHEIGHLRHLKTLSLADNQLSADTTKRLSEELPAILPNLQVLTH